MISIAHDDLLAWPDGHLQVTQDMGLSGGPLVSNLVLDFYCPPSSTTRLCSQVSRSQNKNQEMEFGQLLPFKFLSLGQNAREKKKKKEECRLQVGRSYAWACRHLCNGRTGRMLLIVTVAFCRHHLGPRHKMGTPGVWWRCTLSQLSLKIPCSAYPILLWQLGCVRHS